MRIIANGSWILGLLIALGLLASPAASVRAADKEEHEKVVDIKNIPAAAREAIQKEAGDARITKVLEGSDREGGKPTYYEAKYTKGDQKLEVKVAPDGKLISKGKDDD